MAAAQEERFSRKKHDPDFPAHAIRYCLGQADLEPCQVDYVVFYKKLLLKFDRLLETYFSFVPVGIAHTKKWWLLPISVVLFLFGLLITLGGSAAGPFIYTLF